MLKITNVVGYQCYYKLLLPEQKWNSLKSKFLCYAWTLTIIFMNGQHFSWLIVEKVRINENECVNTQL